MMNQARKEKLKVFLSSLVRKKSIEQASMEANSSEMKRTLGKIDLISIGIGCTIGSGVFVLTASIAKEYTGPSIVISFALAGLASSLTAFSYAEMASMVPTSGSAYTYVITTMGELAGWMTGWSLVIEYLVGAATIASGWTGYANNLYENMSGKTIPYLVSNPPINSSATEGNIKIDKDAIMNVPGAIIVAILTLVLVVGIQESKLVNNTIVVIKVIAILLFVFFGAKYVSKSNYVPFVPEPVKGTYGVLGIIRGSQKLFISYIGFDAVSSAAQEAKNPEKDLPVGIIFSLLFCTLLYIAVSLILCGVTKYTDIEGGSISKILSKHPGTKWLEIVINIGAVSGLTSAILVSLMAHSRLLMAVSNDGMLPSFFGRLHKKFKTPYWASIVTGSVCIILASFFPVSILSDVTSCGALLVFTFVNVGVIVLKITQPERKRTYKVPFGPYLCPGLGAFITVMLLVLSEAQTKLRIGVWLILGLICYFAFSRRHSQIGKPYEIKMKTRIDDTPDQYQV
ncbi:hypothetical protein BB558_006733 [Smittium angustum]|uniref:Cationic amino acid transporter C-terminal domain-containing protein n=1 Tax=Smittium angustum TaxID=133377 RepID=A0A2U1IWW9_SMIAN|nr:hypothetical protein BB558_006733 [Smittium angustum]